MDLLYELKIIFERFSFSIYVLNSLLKESWAFEVKEKIGYVGRIVIININYYFSILSWLWLILLWFFN